MPKSRTSVTVTTSTHLGDGHVAALSEVGQLRSALELALREAREVAAVTLLGLLLVDQPVEHCAAHRDALRLAARGEGREGM
eukprot:scaffold44979_cov25-Phaeocystis_antarctica.AAC.1